MHFIAIEPNSVHRLSSQARVDLAGQNGGAFGRDPHDVFRQPLGMEEGVRIIYVDLDHALLRIDLLRERLFLTLLRRPLTFFMAAGWLLQGGRARLKTEIARRSILDVAHLPFNEELLAFLKEERNAGQSLVLATAAPHEWALAISRHLAIFDHVLATDERKGNLRGKRKLELIVQDSGGKPFGYAGNSSDLLIFEASQLPIVVGGATRLAGSHADKAVLLSQASSNASGWWKSLYPHQWSKNLLVFAPAVASHRLDTLWPNAVLAFVSFSLVASALYLLNDFCDIDEDRCQPDKRSHALASGALRPTQALALGFFLLLAAAGVAFFLPLKFSLIVLGYAFVNAFYSITAKNIVVLDLLTLTALYLLRVLAGNAACHLEISTWLMVFFFFLTLSLAHLKRYTELRQRAKDGIGWAERPNYKVEDSSLLMKTGLSSGLVAVLTLALYLTSSHSVAIYKTPSLLFVVCGLLFYWIERLWSFARKEMIVGDPVAFIVTDRVSFIVALACAAFIWLAWHF